MTLSVEMWDSRRLKKSVTGGMTDSIAEVSLVSNQSTFNFTGLGLSSLYFLGLYLLL